MAKKQKPKTAPRPSSNSKSRPISFRLSRDLEAGLAQTATRLGVPRNKLVALVLDEYINKRGEDVERVIREDATRARVDLFA